MNVADSPHPFDPSRLDHISAEHFGIQYLYPIQRYAIVSIMDSAGAELSDPKRRDDESHRLSGSSAASNTDIAQGQVSVRIIVMPTGAGKSVCFQLPQLYITGYTLVVYPLLGLMNDQERRITQAGFHVGQLRGGQSAEERERIASAIRTGTIDFVLSNPETLANPAVLETLSCHPPSHTVIDEAHCISEWGDTFRASYLELGRSLRTAGAKNVSAFTATASNHIIQRIQEVLAPDQPAAIYRGNPNRTNISYSVLPVLSKDRALRAIFTADRAKPNQQEQEIGTWQPGDRARLPAIVFCNRRAAAEHWAHLMREYFRERGQEPAPEFYVYHAGLPREERARVEEAFFGAADAILFATCAYGMGVDKANIRLVVHTYLPETPEAFLQESGRGGRDRAPAQSIILYDLGDIERYLENERRGRATPVEEMVFRHACRRSAMLKHFGAEDTACDGCDVCAQTDPGRLKHHPVPAPALVSVLERIVRSGFHRPTAAELARIATGRLGYADHARGWAKHPAYMIAPEWDIWELRDYLAQAQKLGLLALQRSLANRLRKWVQGRMAHHRSCRRAGTATR